MGWSDDPKSFIYLLIIFFTPLALGRGTRLWTSISDPASALNLAELKFLAVYANIFAF
jgi:hypothetical protein